MLILAVDTSTRIGSLAVLRDQEVLGETSSSEGDPYSLRLFADLDRLLGELRLGLNHFDLFAVAAGPGSFTGLRVGLTAVKAWAEVYGKPIVPVSGLQAVAAQIPEANGGALLVPVIDARRGQVFGAIYERRDGANTSAQPFLKLLNEEVVMAADEFLDIVAGHGNGVAPLFASPSPEVLQPALELSAFGTSRVQKVSGSLASIIGQLGHQAAAQRGEAIDALHLAANYVRRTDAESKWKES